MKPVKMVNSQCKNAGDAESTRNKGAGIDPILVVLLAVFVIGLGLLNLMIFWPYHSPPDPRTFCIANLKQIEGAKATWALEHKKVPTDTPVEGDLYWDAGDGNDYYIRIEPTCPLGGVYTLGAVGEKPKCSIAGHTLGKTGGCCGHPTEPPNTGSNGR